MEIDLPEVMAEVKQAFERYEKALVSNDVPALNALFRDDARTIRYGGAEILYGYDEIKAFRAARSPVALGRTLSRTVITARAHRAAVVARPSAEHLAGMFEVMAELEALCAGFAAERMNASERGAMEDIHIKLRVLIQSGDPQRYHDVNEAFHASIYAGAHNSYLAEMALATRARVQPFRRAQFRNLGRLANSHVEHDAVVEAILRGDRAAAAAMHAHILTVRDEYEHYSESL